MLRTVQALAVNKLDTTEVGLDYNGISKRVDETRLYEAGRYFLGVRHSFIRFPKLMQTIHFDEEIADTLTTKTIRGRTGDGLAVKVSASFQYRLIPTVESIVMLYKDFGLEWEDFLVVLARDVIRDVFSEFTAFDVFQRRREMNDLTFVYLERAFEEYGHVRLESVQILGIILPDDYNAALRDTQIKKQEIVEAEFDRQTALINRDTAILAATTQAQVIALAANATATSTLLQASAEAAAVQLNIRAEQNAFLQLSDNLNITDPETLNAFIFVQALRQTQSEVLLGVELPDQLGF